MIARLGIPHQNLTTMLENNLSTCNKGLKLGDFCNSILEKRMESKMFYVISNCEARDSPLKVNESQNDFLVSSIFQKTNAKNLDEFLP